MKFFSKANFLLNHNNSMLINRIAAMIPGMEEGSMKYCSSRGTVKTAQMPAWFTDSQHKKYPLHIAHVNLVICCFLIHVRTFPAFILHGHFFSCPFLDEARLVHSFDTTEIMWNLENVLYYFMFKFENSSIEKWCSSP